MYIYTCVCACVCVCVCVSILFQILSHMGCCRILSRVPFAIVGPCELSVLYIVVCIC